MSGFSAIDLTQLPSPDVVEALDHQTILNAILADVVARAPELADTLTLESEPVVKVLEACAYRELLLRARVNDAARAVLLATATGADLDNLGALLGVLRLPDEVDTELRLRIQLSLEGFSTAGPAGAYVFHAFSANGDVRDVHVASENPGEVQVTILSKTGDGVPGAETLTSVEEALNGDDVRPLTDQVIVQEATILPYQVAASVVIEPGFDAAAILAASRNAVIDYADKMHRLGQVISLSGLYDALHQPGVARATLTAPGADITPAMTEAAYCSLVTIAEAV